MPSRGGLANMGFDGPMKGRVVDAIEMWREELDQDSRIQIAAGAGLIGFGLLSVAFALTRKRRGFFAWAIPGALISAGIALLADVTLDSRRERILEAQAQIEERLASLDPFARAVVLKNVGQQQLRSVIPGKE